MSTAHLKPLPIPVGLFPHELPGSLANRLAAANHLPAGWMAAVLAAAKDAGVTQQEALTLLSGREPAVIARALSPPPSRSRFRDDHSAKACVCCVAQRTGRRDTVYAWRPPDRPVCLPHRRWVDHYGQADVHRCPDIVDAQLRHIRLARRHPQWHIPAYNDAVRIVNRWADRREHQHSLQRVCQLVGADRWVLPAHHRYIRAGAYPDVIALAEVLANPYWRRQADPRNRDAVERFLNEIGLRLATPMFLTGAYDPLQQWIWATHRNPYETDHLFQASNSDVFLQRRGEAGWMEPLDRQPRRTGSAWLDERGL